MTACDFCKYGKATREFEYSCSHPLFKARGKVIYPETFKVLRRVGCESAELMIKLGR